KTGAPLSTRPPMLDLAFANGSPSASTLIGGRADPPHLADLLIGHAPFHCRKDGRPAHCCPGRSQDRPGQDRFKVDLKALWGFPRSALPPSNWHLFKSSKGVIRCRYEQLPPA